MLVLLDQNLAIVDGVRLLLSNDNTTLLLSPPSQLSSQVWRVIGGSSAKTLRAWLEEGLERAPQVNRILLVWRSPDDGLLSLLSLLARLPQEYAIRLSVLLVGPLSEEVELNSLLDSASIARPEPLVQHLFFIGNEDTEANPIDSPRRGQMLLTLLELLIATGGEAGDLLFDDIGSRPRNTFRGFGFQRWSPSIVDCRKLVEHLATGVLRKQLLEEPPSVAFEQEELTRLPSRLFEILRMLGTPLEGSDADRPARFSDRFPPARANPFEEWKCPHQRQAAIREGTDLIDDNSREIRSYHATLVSRLSVLSAEARSHGQEIFIRTREELRGKIAAASSLSDLARLLRSFFPAFEALRTERFTTQKEPCDTASSPAADQWRSRFVHSARDELFESAQRLPTSAQLAVFYTVSGAPLALALVALLASWPTWLSAGSALLAVGFWVFVHFWSRQRAKQVQEEMLEYFAKANRWLRDLFVDKVNWVVDKTQQSLEIQLVSAAEAFGHRLGSAFSSIFRQWEELVRGTPGRPQDEFNGLGLSDESLDGLRDRVADFVKAIVAWVGSDAADEEGIVEPERILDDLSRDVYLLLRKQPLSEESVDDELMNCAAQRLLPPILTRLDDQTLQHGVSKVFFLPHEYSDAIINRIESAGKGTPIRVRRASISGPAVWISSAVFDADLMRRSLRIPRVGI